MDWVDKLVYKMYNYQKHTEDWEYLKHEYKRRMICNSNINLSYFFN